MRRKQCTRCGLLLPLTKFYAQPKGKWGRRASCIQCCSEAQAEWRRDHPRPSLPPEEWKARYGEMNRSLQKARQRALRALAARHPDEFEHLLIIERALLEPTKEKT